MTIDIRLAFDHPEARSVATAPTGLLDRISLRGHLVEVEIGAFQLERDTTQRISFDVVVEVVPLTGPIDDDVDRILSYDRVTEAISHELAAERLNLLETLAERVAERILLEPQAQRVFVRIQKLDRGPGALGVEIVRSRAEVPMIEVQDGAGPRPVVAYLSNTAIASGQVTHLVDDLAALGKPLIFCVEFPSGPILQSDRPNVQRRIDLLALDQKAWSLAGLDDRCTVVGTRTELDWAIKNGMISVWAPSKIVLDAVEGPNAAPKESLALAAWFAAQMNALEFVTLGVAPPKLHLPVREIRLEPAL